MDEPQDASAVGRSHAADSCLRCGSTIASLGVESFRVGGTSGGWKLLFGELAELGEDTVNVELLGCSTCGHIEMRQPGFA
jgi:hypothetical protein